MHVWRARPSLIALCGLPGAGKSSLVPKLLETYPGALVLETDVIRAAMGLYIPGLTERFVVQAMEGMALGALHGGRDVIIDATNLTVERRGLLLWWALHVNAYTEIHYIPCDEKESLRRSTKWIDADRIAELRKSFKMPRKAEGWRKVVRHPRATKGRKKSCPQTT